MRRHSIPTGATPTHTPAKPAVVDVAHELDYLDIPAFLRRKEDAEV